MHRKPNGRTSHKLQPHSRRLLLSRPAGNPQSLRPPPIHHRRNHAHRAGSRPRPQTAEPSLRKLTRRLQPQNKGDRPPTANNTSMPPIVKRNWTIKTKTKNPENNSPNFAKTPATKPSPAPATFTNSFSYWLDKFYLQLANRQDQGTPYPLRHCAYHQDSQKEKIDMDRYIKGGRFSYDDRGIYCEATAFLMTGNSIKYLCALLNAKLTYWFL